MKTTIGLCIAFLVSLLAQPASEAQSTYYWAPNGSPSYTDGVWSTGSTTNWASGSATGSPVAWTNGNTAVFGGSGYTAPGNTSFTITLGSDITVGGYMRLNYMYTGLGLTITGGANDYTLTVPSIWNDSSAPLTLDVVIAGTSGVEKALNGTVIFAMDNTYSGGTTVTGNTNNGGGILQIGDGGMTGSLGAGAVTMVAKSSQTSYATLQFDRSDDIEISNDINFSSSGGSANYNGGIISGTTGAGKVVFSGTQTIGAGASGTYTATVTSGSTTGPDMTITGALSGAGNFYKAGAGVLAITSTFSTYTGNTVVQAGTLLFNGNSSGQGYFLVEAGATLGGTGTIGTNNANVTLNSGAFLAPGDSASIGTLTFDLGTGYLAVGASNSGELVFDLGSTANSDQVVLASGALNIGAGQLGFSGFAFTTTGGFGAGTYTLISSNTSIVGSLGSDLSGSIDGYAATLSISGGDLLLTVAAIPEAPVLPLVLAATAAALGLWWRKRRRGRPLGTTFSS